MGWRFDRGVAERSRVPIREFFERLGRLNQWPWVGELTEACSKSPTVLRSDIHGCIGTFLSNGHGILIAVTVLCVQERRFRELRSRRVAS